METYFDDQISTRLNSVRRKRTFGTRKCPVMANWVTEIGPTEDGRGFKVRRELDGKEYALKWDAYRFLSAMDGHTRTDDIIKAIGLDSFKGYSYYSYFCEEALIRTGRRLSFGVMSVLGNHKIPGSFTRVFNFLLTLIFIPVFLIGCNMYFSHGIVTEEASIELSLWGYILRTIVTITVSIFFHEMCHAVAVGHILEAGVYLRGIFFGGYVIGKKIKNRGQRLRYALAGIKGNLLLSGLAAILCCIGPNMAVLFDTCFHINLILGLLNLLPIGNVTDGFVVLAELIGLRESERDFKSMFGIIHGSFKRGDWVQAVVVSVIGIVCILTATMFVLNEASYIVRIFI